MNWHAFSAHLRRFSETDRALIHKAHTMGEEAHGDQRRKSGESYFIHPTAVAKMLIDIGADADTVIAALLHDTIEDTDLTLDDIEKEFGPHVRAMIDGLTKLEAPDFADKPTLNEQTETLRKMFILMQQDVRIMVIKLIDKLHNLMTIEHLSHDRQLVFAREALEAYVIIADRLSMQDIRDDLEARCIAILEPNEYPDLVTMRKHREKMAHKAIPQMQKKMQQSFKHTFSLSFEHATWEKTRAQYMTDSATITGLANFSIVVLCESVADCYAALGALHQSWRRETLSFQDYINSPLINGYRGLHTTVILEDGTRVRCKMRTHEMQEYARRGITVKCFGKHAVGLLDQLPWTQHLNELSSDTKRRSDDFWESLQSDILGESIIIHGPGDDTLSIPLGATALDAASFLFQDNALKIRSIKVNGKDTRFDDPVPNAASIFATFDDEQTVMRSWLTQVNTGFATALIRSALATGSHKKRAALGRHILQGALDERKLGYLEEFNPSTFTEALRNFGYDTLPSALEAIADGHLDPRRFIENVFDNKRIFKESDKAERYFLRVALNRDNPDELGRTVNSIRALPHFDNLSVRHKGQRIFVRGQAVLTPDERDNVTQQLERSGVVKWENRRMIVRRYLSIVVLVLLWGFDPVLSKIFLGHGIEPATFTIIRSEAVFVLSLGILITSLRERDFMRIPLLSPALWLAGISFFLMSLVSYMALSESSPTLYNTILRGNALLIALPALCTQRHWKIFGFTIFCTITAIGSLLLIDVIPPRSILLCAGVLVIFFLYTIASNRFQRDAKILARYPQFFFATSTIAATMSFIFMAMNPPTFPSSYDTTLLAFYCAAFIGVPYILFYALTRNIGYAALSPWINMSLLVTMLNEIAVYGMKGILPYIPAASLLLIASFVASAWSRRNLTSDLAAVQSSQSHASDLPGNNAKRRRA